MPAAAREDEIEAMMDEEKGMLEIRLPVYGEHEKQPVCVFVRMNDDI